MKNVYQNFYETMRTQNWMKNFEMKKSRGKKSRFRSISIAMNVYNFALQSCILISIEIRFHHEYGICYIQNLNSQLIFVIFFSSFFSFYGFYACNPNLY